MKVFQRVVDEGGFAAAARALDMSPAGVTRLVGDLEQHLGARLMHRTTRKLVAGPEHDKLSAYFNLDNGAGKIRGIYLQGNEAARPLFRRWLAPFADLGAETITLSNTGGADHQSFDGVGLAGFQFIQDSLDYWSLTHHSNMDTLDRIVPDDLKQASVLMAAFVYQAAMADEKVPRKPERQDTTSGRRR